MTSSSSSSKEAHDGRKEEEEEEDHGTTETNKALDPARSKEYVRKLIQEQQISSSSSSSGSLVRVEVTDGRTFEGTLGCVDKQLNVVLINATETKKRNEINEGEDASSSTTSSSERLGETRVINMALIAREHRVKMEVLVDDDAFEKEGGEDEVKKENKSLLESALETMRII